MGHNHKTFVIKNADTEQYVKAITENEVLYCDEKKDAETFEGRMYVSAQCKKLRESTEQIHVSEMLK